MPHLNRGEDGRNVIDRTPLILQNVEADAAVGIHVWVKALGHKLHLGRLVRVVLGKGHFQLERGALPRRVVGAGRAVGSVVGTGFE